MKLAKIQELLSIPRFDRYLNAVLQKEKQAIELYRLNMKVAQRFHPFLGILEVALRNKLDVEIAIYFKAHNWTTKSRHLLPYKMVQLLNETEKRIVARGGTITHAKLISDQSLGFWTEMFEKSNFKRLGGSPIQALKHLPANIKREDLRLNLKKVRTFRNRINHNDPICFRGAKIDFSEAISVYQHLIDLLDWIDPETRTLLKGVDEVEQLLKRILIKYP
jgi:hypothetical protein